MENKEMSMDERVEEAITDFRYKRARITANAWFFALLTFLAGMLVINLSARSQIEFLQSPWVTVAILFVTILLAVTVHTYYLDFRLRKILMGFDFVLEEYVDPIRYLEVIDVFSKRKKRRVSPAYLHARLRAMMYASTPKEMTEFLVEHADVLDDTLNVQMAKFRALEHGERLRDMRSFKEKMSVIIDDYDKKARTDDQRAIVRKQQLWLSVELGLLQNNLDLVLTDLEELSAMSLTNLEQVRVLNAYATCYERQGDHSKAKHYYKEVIKQGNTTRYVVEAKKSI